MIIGIGSDIVDIRRIERSLEEFGDRFVSRIFTDEERQRAEGLSNPAPSLAKRFAAKEAVWKALGEGPRLGIAWRELRVTNDESGKPFLRLEGRAESRLREITPSGWEPRIDLSLSDEPPYAQAFVVISARHPDW